MIPFHTIVAGGPIFRKIWIGAFCTLIVFTGELWAQPAIDSVDAVVVQPQLKQARKDLRQQWRKEIHARHNRFFLGANYTFSNLLTTVSFKAPDDFVSITLRMESDLKLPETDGFFSVNFLGRITPRSSIYATFYGINRRSKFTTDRDYIFLGDTIPKGTFASPFFNTNVISLGYMFSAITETKAFLGFYFNLYFLFLKTGVDTNIGDVKARFSLDVPLPNLGFLVDFELTPWLIFKAKAGFFTLRLDNFGGRLYDFNIGLSFRPLSWLSLAVSYQEFDILVDFPRENLDTSVRYNFRGPTVGLSFSY